MKLQKEIGIDENKIDTIRMIAYSRGQLPVLLVRSTQDTNEISKVQKHYS